MMVLVQSKFPSANSKIFLEFKVLPFGEFPELPEEEKVQEEVVVIQ